MLYSLAILFAFNLLYEVLVVAYTIAVADKKRMYASVLSALIEPVRLISLLLVFESTSKWISVLVLSCACGVGNWFTIALVCKWRDRQVEKSQESMNRVIESTRFG